LKKLLVLVLALIAVAIAWGVLRRSRPPRVDFARVTRQTLVSALSTNGKAEPFEWREARAETAGLVKEVPIRDGQVVAEGATLAVIDDPALDAEVRSADARVAEASANFAAFQAGGKPAEIADIENSMARVRLDLERERREYDSLRRLAEKQAATAVEVTEAGDKTRQSEAEIAGLEKRRASLVAETDVDAAAARLKDAVSALALARQRTAHSVVRAPSGGVVYETSVRPGAYVKPGDLVARIGRMDLLRVRVYVDEPELGRVAAGDVVTITWDGLPGRNWLGKVEQKPVSIQALGPRQVGEVVCAIENPGRELAAGANVNAEIRTAAAGNALAIPKEAMRRDAAGDYVLALAGDHVERRPIHTGVSNIAQVQVTEGLAEGDAVALPSGNPLNAGDRVTAVVR
jgi:HlyD family secretion protein